MPESRNLQPDYQQFSFDPRDRDGRLQLVASNEAREGVIRVYQDVQLYLADLRSGQSISHPLASDRRAWVHVARGEVRLNGSLLTAGDGVAIENEPAVELTSDSEGEVLLFDLE